MDDVREEASQSAIENYEPPPPTCERCSRDSYWVLCSEHYQEDLENARKDREDTDNEAELRYQLQLRDNEIRDLKGALKDQEALTRQVQQQLLKGTTSVGDSKENIAFIDAEGNYRQMTSETFLALVGKETNLFPAVWPETAGDPKRTIVNDDGYRTNARDLSVAARVYLGMVFPEETKRATNITVIEDDELPDMEASDKLIIADLLQREQLRRFLTLREAFVNNPAPEAIGIIPSAVVEALDGYQAVTNLMKRIGVDALRNDVMEQMASIMSERVNQQTLSN